MLCRQHLPLRSPFWRVLVVVLQPAAAGPYLDYATRLTQSPPDGAQYRPDLEEELAGLANAYRSQKGKPPLQASDDFLIAARAHAADMMLNDFVGHRASTGHSFDSRMRAFVGDITSYPSLGENAARDTQNTPVDDAQGARAVSAVGEESVASQGDASDRSYRFRVDGCHPARRQASGRCRSSSSPPRQKGIFQ